jgi:formate dehydrogenase maturation protein FdhE
MHKRVQKDGKWKCGSCKKWKIPTEFFKDSRNWNGIRSICKECSNGKDNEYMWKYNIEKKYSLPIEQYEELLVKQNGVCAICGSKQTDSKKHGRLCIDHDHETEKIRGLLCSNCNTALGLMKDDITRLARAIEYLTNQQK